jgi:hypothetical protein
MRIALAMIFMPLIHIMKNITQSPKIMEKKEKVKNTKRRKNNGSFC